MQIDRVITGSLEENCYILGIEDKVLIIDPGDDIDKINVRQDLAWNENCLNKVMMKIHDKEIVNDFLG